MLSLRNVAKRLKESLSRQLLFDEDTSRVPQRTVTLVMRDGEIFRGGVKLDKEKFNDLTSNLLRGFKNLIESGLTTIGLDEGNIGQIVLVGGGAQLFSIIQHLEHRFPGIDLILADNPDESVVVGTSLEYGAASERARPSLLFMGDIDALTEEPLPEEGEPKIEELGFVLESPLGDTFHLVEGENRVGRSASNEIHIPAEKLSRHHARLLLAGDNLEVIDLGSTNGTFVNDARLEKNQPTPLKPGDDIRFGDHSYQVNTSK